MSMNQPAPRSAQDVLKLRRPMSVAIYDDYTDAAHAVDYLADRQFPVATLAIVGTDLRSIEKVTGNMTWGKVLGAGFLQGSMWAGMFAIIMWVIQPGSDLLTMLLMGLVGFGLVGMAMAALQYRMRGGQRDYTSTTAIIATHYEVLAEAEYSDKARSMLGGGKSYPRSEPATENQEPAVLPKQSELDKLPPPTWPAPSSGETATGEPEGVTGAGGQPSGNQPGSSGFPGAQQYPAPARQAGQGTPSYGPGASSEPTPEQSGPGFVEPSPESRPEDGSHASGRDSRENKTSASNLSYGQYWNEGDAPGIGNVPKRFSEAEQGSDDSGGEDDDAERNADQQRRGDNSAG